MHTRITAFIDVGDKRYRYALDTYTCGVAETLRVGVHLLALTRSEFGAHTPFARELDYVGAMPAADYETVKGALGESGWSLTAILSQP